MDRYEAWAEDRREGLRQQYISLLLEIARLQEDDGQAIEVLSEVVAEQPTHEGAHAAGLCAWAAPQGSRAGVRRGARQRQPAPAG